MPLYNPVPAGTTSSAGELELDGTASDIQPVGAAAAAGASGLAADAKHVHVGLLPANNLSDLASASTARTNLGLGTAATDSAGTFAQVANNLSDLASDSTARTNLGLGSAATLASAAVAQTANNLSDVASASTALSNLGGLPTAGGTMSGPIAMGSHKVTGLTNGSNPQDAMAFSQMPVLYSAQRSASLIAAPIPLYAVTASTGACAGGILYIARLNLFAGQTVSNVTFLTGTTGATTMSHGWAAILNTSYLQLAHSADVTSGNLAAETFITWALTSAWTAPSTGQYWAGISITASTQPTIAEGNSQASAGFAAFPLFGPATTGLGGPGTDGTTTYEAPTAAAGCFYIDVD